MVTKAGLRREEREKQSRIMNGVSSCGALVSGLFLFVLPRTGPWISADLTVAVLVSLYCVWHCWGLHPTKFKRMGFLILHIGLAFAVAYSVWPKITVSPGHVAFAGYPDETFNFSVKNDRPDDVYDVQIPFPIGQDKHFDDKLSAKVSPNGDPPQRLYDDYNYCYGVGGDVKKVTPHEQEVFIVRIRHLPPSGIGSFSITYKGGEKFETKPGTPNFIAEPYSYSPMQGTVGVRGDYRICKYAIATDGMVGKGNR
jgi:hypothetical protein